MAKIIQQSKALSDILEEQRKELENGVENPNHFKNKNKIKYLDILPTYFEDNLKHSLRYYQKDSFLNLLYLENTIPSLYLKELKDDFKDNHFLFNLPTGAGKTTIMAGNIIHSIANGYKHFIYFTNSTNLIEQTKDSFLHYKGSKTCEFKKEALRINNKIYTIKEVDKFTETNNEIQIMFCTSNRIHSIATEIKENYQGLIELEKFNIIFLADEAHHFQAQTKKNVKEDNNWENSIQKLLCINKANNLYEFTGTAELHNSFILEKYKSKLVYNYTLSQFNRDGFCKEIKLIQIDKIEDRIMFAIINNHMRTVFLNELEAKNIAKVFFKSTGTIEKFKKEQDYVFDLIKNFNGKILNRLISKTKHILPYSIENFIAEHYEGDKSKIIADIQNFYIKENSVSIHSKDSKNDKEYKMKVLKSLDYEYKEIRMVFAIDMLNEGWNVLSLYDIVKLDEITNKQNITTKENQLIGRGTRPCPFEYNGVISKQRIFDKDPDNKYKMLEECYYYSANDNKYISNLQKDLIAYGYTVTKNEEKSYTKIEFNENLSDFGKSLLEEGYMYLNEKKFLENKKLNEIINNNIEDIVYCKNFDSVSSIDINFEQLKQIQEVNIYNYSLSKFIFNIDNVLNEEEFINILEDKKLLLTTNYFILYKIFMNNEFSKFDYFKEYLNNEKNLNIFQQFLMNLIISNKIYIKTDKNINHLSYKNKEDLCKGVLEKIHKFIEENKKKYIGTEFNNKVFFKERYKPFYVSNSIELINKKEKPNYLFESINKDSFLEENFYKELDNFIKRYKLEILVIRNNNYQKLYLPNGKGFIVDTFLVYKYENKLYQFLIEQKGEHLINYDSDKKSFLINNGRPLYEDEKICMKGFDFYTEKNKISFFDSLLNDLKSINPYLKELN